MEKLFLYPPASRDPADFNLLTVPATALKRAFGERGIAAARMLEFSGVDLHWLKTNVGLDDWPSSTCLSDWTGRPCRRRKVTRAAWI